MNSPAGGLSSRILGLLAFVALAAGALPWSTPAADDPVIAAMQAEVTRTMDKLQLPGSPKPYFVACAIRSVRNTGATASFGSVVSSGEMRDAEVSVTVRVGDYKLDNSNFAAKQMWGGESRLDWATEAPIDGDPEVIRRVIWWAVDQAYKSAVENLKRKKMVLEHRSTPPVADDFIAAPATTYLTTGRPQKLPPLEAVERRSRDLSKILAATKTLVDSTVGVLASADELWYVNSEGTKIHTVDNRASVVATASAQADDGVNVADRIQTVVRLYDELPSPDVQKAEVARLGERVAEMRTAPLLDDFAGPVLFEGEAAAELCARVLPRVFGNRRQPIIEGDRGGAERDTMRHRIGRRVMTTGLNVVDDPSLKTFDGLQLFGYREIDLEGVRPERVQLVKNGYLKTLLTTRTPDKKLPASNGHALSYGYDMSGTSLEADITSLLISADNGLDETALREKLLQAIKEQETEYGLLIRHLPHGGRRMGDEEKMLQDTVLVSCVYPDGKEKPARMVALKGVGLGAFKEVLAAGKKMHVTSFGGRTGLSSVVCPSLLFEEGLVVKPERNLSKPPLLPSPMLAGQNAGAASGK
ncbi:MAG: hypothetical protein C0404_00045 [Verrucomicrobia bacterium]|nr:hypothetical protein [Verrucomicrobiota bacterium]